MDPSRQIRLLIPPFFFLTTFFSGVYFAPFGPWLIGEVNSRIPFGTLISFIAVATLPIGFVISTCTIFLLRILFAWSSYGYNMDMSRVGLRNVWRLLKIQRPSALFAHKRLKRIRWKKILSRRMRKRIRKKRLHLHMQVVFDHEVLRKSSEGTHEWHTRTYSAYMISANSVIAIILAYISIAILVICDTLCWPFVGWWIVSTMLLALLSIGAWRARRDNLWMTEFQAHRDWTKPRPDPNIW